MPRRLSLLICLLTCACGSLPVSDGTQEYHLSEGTPGPVLVTVIDTRTAQDLGPANESGMHRVNDRLLSPHPADFMAAELSRTIAASPDAAELQRYLAGRSIVIRRFAVQEVPYNHQRAQSAGVPVGQQAIGSLITAAVDSLSGTKEVRLEVETELGGREIGCSTRGSARGTPSYDATLQPAAECVEQFVSQLRNRIKEEATPTPRDVAPAASGVAS